MYPLSPSKNTDPTSYLHMLLNSHERHPSLMTLPHLLPSLAVVRYLMTPTPPRLPYSYLLCYRLYAKISFGIPQNLMGYSIKWCKINVFNQEISYIRYKGEMNCSTVTDYITQILNIIEIEKKCVRYKKNRSYQLNQLLINYHVQMCIQ